MGHIHPTITLSDKMNIKREKYKSFLIGRHKKKDFIILPSFIGITEGISANEFADEKGYDFSIIPLKELENFDVYVVQDPNISSESEALCFGKLKNLREKV
jgi:metallophosphoesterase superfamily enzyme